jgi:hypothetical protein
MRRRLYESNEARERDERDERELSERMAALGRRSGEARWQKRAASPREEESALPEDLPAWATGRLVELARSTSNAAASVAAARELLNRAPEPKVDVTHSAMRGLSLADLVNANRNYRNEAITALATAIREGYDAEAIVREARKRQADDTDDAGLGAAGESTICLRYRMRHPPCAARERGFPPLNGEPAGG